MGRLRGRLARLERRRLADDIEEEQQGLTMAQRHYRRAFARATPAEQKKLCAQTTDKREKWRLWEEVLRREAPTLADDIRVHRDLLYQELAALEQELLERGYDRRAGESRRPFSEVATAKVNRCTVISRGAEPIEDPERARDLAEQITACTSVDQVLELIGWR
jgi:hypothetical protein